MGQKHSGGIPVPNLERVDVIVVLAVIHIDEELGRVPDARNGLEGVVVTKDRKIRDGIQLKKKRAGNLKKVPDH